MPKVNFRKVSKHFLNCGRREGWHHQDDGIEHSHHYSPSQDVMGNCPSLFCLPHSSLYRFLACQSESSTVPQRGLRFLHMNTERKNCPWSIFSLPHKPLDTQFRNNSCESKTFDRIQEMSLLQNRKGSLIIKEEGMEGSGHRVCPITIGWKLLRKTWLPSPRRTG